MFLYIFIAVSLLAVIVIFAFPRFSPIPYFPSNGKDLSLILNALDIRSGQTIIDLGAGDGIVIYNAAKIAYEKKLTTNFVAVEINPVLLFILHFRRLFHPNKKNIHIINADMFSCSYKKILDLKLTKSTTFYLYISPWFIEKTIKNITKQIKTFEVVSYFYQVKCLPQYEEHVVEGVHSVFSYHRSSIYD